MNQKKHFLVSGKGARCALLHFDEIIADGLAFAGQDLSALLLSGQSYRLALIWDAVLTPAAFQCRFSVP